MHSFNYHRVGSVEEAVQVLSNAPDGTLMGGGMTLLPTLKLRLASPSDVVDLGGVSGIEPRRLEHVPGRHQHDAPGSRSEVAE